MDSMTQPHEEPAPRLTLRRLAHEFLRRFLNLDSGWLHTARELTTQPGRMIRRYVEGYRREFANPFAYLMVASGLNLAGQSLIRYQERMVAGLHSDAGQTPAQAALIDQMTELLFANMLYVAFGLFIPLAVVLRLFFLRSGRNLAEVLVFALYTGGHLALLGLPLLAATLVVRPGGLIHTASGLLLAIAYMTWATGGFFAGSWPVRAVKVAASYLLSYVFLMIVVMVGTIVWVVSFGLGPGHALGEDWDLLSATEQGSAAVVGRLLEEGADPDLIRRRTALHVAAEHGNAEIVGLLIDHGADLNARDHLGRTPLLLAVARNWPEVARTLREAGADATVRTERGTSLLMAALQRGDRETALWALDNGVDVNAVRADAAQSTALMIAAAKGDLAMVDLLLSRGADAHATNQDGKTALDLARSAEVRARLAAAVRGASGAGT